MSSIRHALVAALCLLAPGTALGHETGPVHAHGTAQHGDPRQALPDTLVTQPVAAAELGTLEPPAFDSGSAPETWCGTETTSNDTANAVVAATTPHLKLVYAYASDQTNRFDTLKHRLQANVSLLQRYLAAQSGGRKALRWDMGTDCGSQYVDIQVVALPKTRAEYVPSGSPSFSTTRDDVFAAIGGVASPRNVVIYADGLRGTNGVAGTASRWVTDSTHATAHDSGGLGAVVWGPQTLPSSTYADPAVMMHEIAHNLGAVQDGSPHSTKAGHCNDERDLMCYADGGADGQAGDMVQSCSTISGDMNETFDCGGDDYFNPKPGQDTYLDLNWNTYSIAHLAPCSTELVDSCGLAGEAGDGTKPTNTTSAPAAVWRSTWTPTLAGSDSESPVDAYQWRLGATNGTLEPIQYGQQAAVSGPHATPTFLYTRVRDSSGNWSAWRRDVVYLDTVAPTATVTCPSTWSTTTAPTCSYTVSEVTSGVVSSETQKGSDAVSAGGTSGSLVATADAQTIRVRGTDAAGNTGGWASATARWDRVNPTVSVTCPEEWVAAPATCHVAASDTASGIASVTWRVGGGPATTVAATSDFAVTGFGEQEVTVVATDVAGRTSQATATARITAPAAEAVADSKTVTEDSGAGEVDVLANDVAPIGGAVEIAGATDPAHGSVTLSGGTLSFAPDPDFCGVTTFDYSLSGAGGATVTMTVTCVDDAPAAVADSETVGEDSGATTFGVRGNDTDADAGTKTITSTTGATHGTVAIAGGGDDLTYAPAENYCGPDNFTYTLNGGAAATVTVTVTCVDDAPVAVNDAKLLPEDAPATAIDVRANDADSDGGVKSVVAKTNGAHGVVAIAGGGTHVTYTPAPNYCGPDVFSYALNGGATANVGVMVTCLDEIDTQAPETTIEKSPKQRMTTRRARAKVGFAFEASEAGSTFRCKLDRGEFEPCRSPQAYRLKPGRHTFSVVAVDPAGNADPTPATKRFRIRRSTA